MLRKPSDKVTDCHDRAQEAREQAERAPEAGKLSYLALERRWLMLAESYELLEYLGDFSRAADQRATAGIAAYSDPAAQCPICGNDMRQTNSSQASSKPAANRLYFACEACDLTALHAGRTSAG